TPPELATAYADAAAAGDSIAADSLRTRLALSLGADTLRSLEARIQGLRTEVDSLREEREPEAGGGIVAYLRGLLDDPGVGFGWSTLYFTLFLAVWRGQTPGKRLLGIRVVRLNGKPITWWASFERFGGYAAGLATGLLGFLQIFWDRNRQAIHDKIMETVVVRERVVPETHPASAAPAAEAVPASAPAPDALSGSGVPATEPAPDEQTGS
ncbi:MAG: RDD family protein, partial [Gemmatimonadetes bacterium]|nr:RDD family protein [Gemmatimonadota bacterium]